MKAGTAKVASKDEVVANLSGIETGRRRRHVRIPEGDYQAKLVRAEAGQAKTSGNPMVTWQFEIVGGKYEGTPLYHRTVLIPESLWNYRRVLSALGVKVKDATMKIKLSTLVGREVGLEVVDDDGSYDGKIRSQINDVFDAAEMDESEEEDVEEDEEDEEDLEEDEELEDEEDEEEEEDEDWDEDEVDLDDEDL